MSDETDPAPSVGMLTDHTGKNSSSRLTSFAATVAIVAIVVGVTFFDAQEPSNTILWILASMVLGPIGINRWFGEGGGPFRKP